MTLITKGNTHKHIFDIPKTQKVLLSSGLKQGQDLLKQLACKCGRVLTYDLERLDGKS